MCRILTNSNSNKDVFVASAMRKTNDILNRIDHALESFPRLVTYLAVQREKIYKEESVLGDDVRQNIESGIRNLILESILYDF